MPIVPLYGHEALRKRLAASAERGLLPSSLLIHGPRGIGKQRLALWLGQLLLCTEADRPCGHCVGCRYAGDLVHPDLRWFFPRPRLSEAGASGEEVLDDLAEAIADRVKSGGLYAAPSGSEAIFVASVRAIVQLASRTPAVGSRKVFVIGDAERMVPQEGADAAANAFLKLLEEPPRDTTLILTSSEPGALLPTIRSRVVAVRAAPLPEADLRRFIEDPAVAGALERVEGLPAGTDERIRLAAGSPGTLVGGLAAAGALAAAAALIEAAEHDRAEQFRAAFALGGSRARGFFSDLLDSLTVLLADRMRRYGERDDAARARDAGLAIEAVERTKLRAAGNVNPQLLGASLLRELAALLR